MKIEIESRASGRTFRRLLRTLAQASAGHKVLFVVNNERIAKWTMEKAANIVGAYHGNKQDIQTKMASKKISFPNGGFFRIVHHGNAVEGLSQTAIEIDIERFDINDKRLITKLELGLRPHEKTN